MCARQDDTACLSHGVFVGLCCVCYASDMCWEALMDTFPRHYHVVGIANGCHMVDKALPYFRL